MTSKPSVSQAATAWPKSSSMEMSACNLLSSSHVQLTKIGIRMETIPSESVTDVQFATSN